MPSSAGSWPHSYVARGSCRFLASRYSWRWAPTPTRSSAACSCCLGGCFRPGSPSTTRPLGRSCGPRCDRLALVAGRLAETPRRGLAAFVGDGDQLGLPRLVVGALERLFDLTVGVDQLVLGDSLGDG